MTFLKWGSAVGLFAWVTLSSDCRLELQVESESEPADRQREFRKSSLFDGVRNICSHRIHFNMKSLQKVLLSLR